MNLKELLKLHEELAVDTADQDKAAKFRKYLGLAKRGSYKDFTSVSAKEFSDLHRYFSDKTTRKGQNPKTNQELVDASRYINKAMAAAKMQSKNIVQQARKPGTFQAVKPADKVVKGGWADK